MGSMPKDKKALIHAYRTQGILEAARKVIAERGFDNATMGEVAAEAGISKATIYLYFKNKDELYFNCVLEKLDGVISAIKEAVKGIDDPIELLRVAINVQIKKAEEDEDFFRVFLTEKMTVFLNTETEFGREYYRRHMEYTRILSGALEEGMKRGLIRRLDPYKCSQTLLSMIRGMAILKIINKSDRPCSDEVDLIFDLFLNGVSAVK